MLRVGRTGVVVSLLFVGAASGGPALGAQAGQSGPPHGAGGAAHLPPQVTGVQAVHASGQTFLTWREDASLDGESYKIYRSLTKIVDVRDPSVKGLNQRTWEDSGEFYAGRIRDERPCEEGAPDCGRPNKPLPCFRPRYVERYWIPDGKGSAREVADGEGLLVWTPGAQGFPQGTKAAWVWYAVTTVDSAGNENPLVTAANRVQVFERVRRPLPVEVPRSALDCSVPGYCPYDNLGDPNPLPPGVHVFIQYMDVRSWNGTFHAPNFTNCWWGEDPTLPHVRNNRQYAYAYTVHEPDPAHGPCTGKQPVVIDLHSWAGNAMDQGWGAGAGAAYADGGCAVKIVPIDVGDTWWYGFAKDHDYRRPYQGCLPLNSPCDAVGSAFPPAAPYGHLPQSGEIVNYTEFRVLRMLYDLSRQSLPGLKVDTNRVYVQGSSMGGSGALQLATRYPNVFAAAAAAKPMTNYETYLTGVAPDPESDVRHEVVQRFGAWPALAAAEPSLGLLTVQSVGPAGMADHLAPWNGAVVWDWMDLVRQLNDPYRRELGGAPFGIASGYNDTVLPYPTQGEPFFSAANAPGLSWGGKIGCGGHGGPALAGMPAALSLCTGNPNPAPFSDYSIRRRETVPGFAALTAGAYPTPPTTCCNSCLSPGPYWYYDDLVWSSSWYSWDQPPVDLPDRWEISVRWDGSYSPAPTVDVTPRRTQRFDVVPGATYQWTNVEIATGNVVQAPQAPLVGPPTIQLLRVPGVRLSPGGNRIVVQRVSPPSTTGNASAPAAAVGPGDN